MKADAGLGLTLTASDWQARRNFSASMWLRSAVNFLALSVFVAASNSCTAGSTGITGDMQRSKG